MGCVSLCIRYATSPSFITPDEYAGGYLAQLAMGCQPLVWCTLVSVIISSCCIYDKMIVYSVKVGSAIHAVSVFPREQSDLHKFSAVIAATEPVRVLR